MLRLAALPAAPVAAARQHGPAFTHTRTKEDISVCVCVGGHATDLSGAQTDYCTTTTPQCEHVEVCSQTEHAGYQCLSGFTCFQVEKDLSEETNVPETLDSSDGHDVQQVFH